MKTLLLTALLLSCSCARAQSLTEFQWLSRPLILFAPSADDPLFLQQYQALAAREEELRERRIKILFVTPEGRHENTGLFLDESLSEWYYRHFDAQPYQFEMVLVGLDGHEKFRARNTVTAPLILLELVDEMPMRRRELLQGYQNKSQRQRETDRQTRGN